MPWFLAGMMVPWFAAYFLVAYGDREAPGGAVTFFLRASLATGISLGLSSVAYFLGLFCLSPLGRRYCLLELAGFTAAAACFGLLAARAGAKSALPVPGAKCGNCRMGFSPSMARFLQGGLKPTLRPHPEPEEPPSPVNGGQACGTTAETTRGRFPGGLGICRRGSCRQVLGVAFGRLGRVGHLEPSCPLPLPGGPDVAAGVFTLVPAYGLSAPRAGHECPLLAVFG